MAEQLNLNKYKRSDVYTVEVDKTQSLSLPLSQGRLVIGSSRKGPINTVVQVNSTSEAKSVYGDIDSKLESKGSYFHRTIKTLLQQGPVFAINVLPVNNTDTVEFTSFNTESASTSIPQNLVDFTQPISRFFNTQRFWFASEESLNSTKESVLTGSNANKILSLVNLGKRAVTTFVHSTSVNGYDLTVKEYYSLFGEDTPIPNFLSVDDLVSDYFVEVIVVEGDWSNYHKLATDPVYSVYFNASGFIKDKINDFLNLREVKTVIRATGSLIPGFKDQSGNTASIDKIVNSLYSQTEVICAIDTDKLEAIDLSESTFVDSDMASNRVDLVGHGFDDITNYGDDDIAGNGSANKLIDILSYKKLEKGNMIFEVVNTEVLGSLFYYTSGDYFKAYDNSKLYEAYYNGFVKTGSIVVKKTVGLNGAPDVFTNYYLKFETGTTTGPGDNGLIYLKVSCYSDVLLTTLDSQSTIQVDIATGKNILNIVNPSADTFTKTFAFGDTTYFSLNGVTSPAPNQLKLVLNSSITVNNKAVLDSFLKVNFYLKARVVGDSRSRLLKIISISSKIENSKTIYTITTMAPNDIAISGIDVTGDEFKVYKGIKNFIKELKGVFLPAFVLRDSLLPNGSATREDSILGFLFESTKIPQALADKQSVDFRYIVDSYHGQITESSKYYLSQIAALHGQAFVFGNAPSMKQFEKSIDPSFVNPYNKLLSSKYIADGANLDLNPSFTFGFSKGEVNGVPISSYIGYFIPNVVVNDSGSSKSIPPAAYVANEYTKKFNSGNTFSIVAAKKGILTDVSIENLEYEFTDEDRDILEPVGFNPIVKRRGFGKLIMGNNTGYQRVNSALNNIHVREALITIETDVNRILFNFLFDFSSSEAVLLAF